MLNDRALATTLEIAAPAFVKGSSVTSENAKGSGDGSSSGYSVENLLVHPGKSIKRGETLCSLAYHAELYIEGTAFQTDLPTLDRIAEKQWAITAESHHWTDADAEESIRNDLRLLRVDNHVDEETQTVRFFVLITNEAEKSHRDQEGRLFEQWRFRPGERDSPSTSR